jgi:hypothetical protein
MWESPQVDGWNQIRGTTILWCSTSLTNLSHERMSSSSAFGRSSVVKQESVKPNATSSWAVELDPRSRFNERPG